MPITTAEREELRSLIEARRKALAGEIRGDLARSRADSFDAIAGEAPDSGDAATASLVADTENAETNRDIRELQELNAAIERIGEGTYGECAECGDDIPVARLHAYPGAMRCISCQSVYERTHNQPSQSTL